MAAKEYLYTCRNVRRIALLAADEVWVEWPETGCLLVVLEGKGQLEIDGAGMIAGKGSIWFINGKCLVRLKAIHELVAVQVSFHVLRRSGAPEAGIGLTYTEENDGWLPDGEVPVRTFYQAARVVKEMLTLPPPGGERENLQADRLLYELLHWVREDGEERPGDKPALAGETGIPMAVSYIRQHYSEELTRDGMAAMTGFHPGVFSKLFKAETGHGFSEYLAHIRIAKAKEQLLLTGNNLNKIALDVGYSNGLYLSRKFKQVTGVSPKGYLQQSKRVVIYDWVGNLLALGEKPVGATYFNSLSLLALHRRELEGVPDVGNSSVETVIPLKPELIVTPSWQKPELIGQLQKIAPTLIVPYGDPLDRFRELADTLGRREQAERFIVEYREKADEVKADIADIIRPDDSIGLYEISPGSVWVFSEFHGRGGYNLYKALGYRPPARIAGNVMGRGMIKEIAVEELPAYAADHMFISYPFRAEGSAYMKAFMAQDVWRGIQAYRGNRIYFLEKELFHSSDALSLLKQLELQRRVVVRKRGSQGDGFTFVHETSDFNL